MEDPIEQQANTDPAPAAAWEYRALSQLVQSSIRDNSKLSVRCAMTAFRADYSGIAKNYFDSS